MNAKKCDRCGSFYGIRYLSVIEEFAECFNITSRVQEMCRQMEENVDLCPTCSNKLFEWLKGGEFE
jgi:hypothetical protein